MTPRLAFRCCHVGALVVPPILLAGAMLVVLHAPHHPGRASLPEFSQTDITARKQAFFDYLRPIARHFDAQLLVDRGAVLALAGEPSLGWFGRRKLHWLAHKYRVDDQSLDDEEILGILKRRVDIVPVSLVLVQAAKESAWGRSRFAKSGNALFGEWCFTAGCGIVPRARAAGRSHEVEAFATVHDAVGSYMMNLNTHQSYHKMRVARAAIRAAGDKPTGLALVPFLSLYSERREAYVQEVRTMILHNHLEEP